MTQVKVVWGPPAAGKSTHVKENKGENDMIYDFDLLMRDLSGLDIYDRNEYLISYLVDFRAAIIESLETEEQLDTAWIIISFPEGEIKEQLEVLDAEFILIDADKETCYQRIEDDDCRKDKGGWKQVADDWFEKYENTQAKAVIPLKNKNKKFWNFKAKDDDEKTGELMLYGEIASETWWGDEVTPKQFKEDLDALGDIKTLNVFVNSPGGDVFAAQAIYSILKRYDAHVSMYVDGIAASAASLIVSAGDTVIMPKNAMQMLHNPWCLCVGNAGDFRKLADDMDKIRDSMIVAYESRSALTKDEIIDILDAESWLTAEECMEYGFCDEIEDAKEIAACADADYFKQRYQNTPKQLLKKHPKKAKSQQKEEEWRRKLTAGLDAYGDSNYLKGENENV